MSSSSVPKPWRVADVTFVEIEIHLPSERQMRVEFGCGVRLVITGASQVSLAAALIKTLRVGKGFSDDQHPFRRERQSRSRRPRHTQIFQLP